MIRADEFPHGGDGPAANAEAQGRCPGPRCDVRGPVADTALAHLILSHPEGVAEE